MKQYRYSLQSPIDQVTFDQGENGAGRAYLHASTNLPPSEFQKINQALLDEGFYTIPSSHFDQPALEVRGFWAEGKLIKLLEKNSWVTGTPELNESIKPKKTFKEMVKKESLRGASLSFLLADIGFTYYGHTGKRLEDTLAGISYFGGSATMGALGTSAQSSAEIRRQLKKLVKYSKEHDITFDDSIIAPSITHNNKRDVLHKIIDVLQTYPAEIGNSLTALAGVLVATSALRHDILSPPPSGFSAKNINKRKMSGYSDIGLGITTFISGIIGAWVKEKKQDPDNPNAEGNPIYNWIAEKPLRVAGVGYMISTFCHTLSTANAYRLAKETGDKQSLKAIPGRLLFITATIIGEILLTLSSKGHGEGVKSDSSTEQTIISAAANIISQQRPNVQAKLIDNISGFLGRSDVLALKNDEAKTRLTHEVELMRNNPWAHAAENAKTPNVIASAPSAKTKEDALAPWQTKLSMQPVTNQNQAAL